MKHPRPILLALCACLSLCLTACQTTPTWNDAARKTIYTATTTADAFLQYELDHRATLALDVTQAADAIRVQMPPLVREANAALDAYEANPSDTARARATAAMELLNNLANTAANALARVQAANPKGH